MIELLIDIMTFSAIYVMLALALHIQFGYTGIFNIGLHLQAATGAFAAAAFGRILVGLLYAGKGDYIYDTHFIVKELNTYFSTHPLTAVLCLLSMLAVAIAASSLTGWLFAHPALRLHGVYQAIYFLAMAELFVTIGNRYLPLAGGVYGIGLPNFLTWLGGYSRWGFLAILFALCSVSFMIVNRLCHSPFGRLLKTIRENEIAAQASGKDIDAAKVKAMGFSSVLAGLAAFLFAMHICAIIPAAYNGLDFALWPMAMVLVGGPGNIYGAVAGVLTFVTMRRFVYISRKWIRALPFDIAWLEPIMLGAIILVVIIFRPRGIIPERRVVPAKTG